MRSPSGLLARAGASLLGSARSPLARYGGNGLRAASVRGDSFSSDRSFAALPVGVAQLALVELAVRVARHLGDEVNLLRGLLLRDEGLRPIEELGFECGPGRHAGGRLHDGLHL